MVAVHALCDLFHRLMHQNDVATLIILECLMQLNIVHTTFGVQNSMEGLFKALNNIHIFISIMKLLIIPTNRSGHNDHEENSAKHQ